MTRGRIRQNLPYHLPCCFCFGLYIFHQRNIRKPSCILHRHIWSKNNHTESRFLKRKKKKNKMRHPSIVVPDRHVTVDEVDISEHDFPWQHREGEGACGADVTDLYATVTKWQKQIWLKRLWLWKKHFSTHAVNLIDFISSVFYGLIN